MGNSLLWRSAYLAWEERVCNNLTEWVRLIHKSNPYVKWKSSKSDGCIYSFRKCLHAFALSEHQSKHVVCKCLWLHNLLCSTAKIPSICSSRAAEPQNQASALKAEICGQSSLQREYQSLLRLLRLHPPDKTCWVKTESTFATTLAPSQNVFYMLMQTVLRPMSLCSHAFRHRFHSEHSFPLKNSNSSPGSGGHSLKLSLQSCMPAFPRRPANGRAEHSAGTRPAWGHLHGCTNCKNCIFFPLKIHLLLPYR